MFATLSQGCFGWRGINKIKRLTKKHEDNKNHYGISEHFEFNGGFAQSAGIV